jgi:hypothetical protein
MVDALHLIDEIDHMGRGERDLLVGAGHHPPGRTGLILRAAGGGGKIRALCRDTRGLLANLLDRGRLSRDAPRQLGNICLQVDRLDAKGTRELCCRRNGLLDSHAAPFSILRHIITEPN